jgi:heme o synthase
MASSSLFKTYYALTKPGIIYGNALTAAGGFLLASKWHVDFLLFVSLLVGTSLVIASGCVFNNYIDRGIDQKMARTKRRAIVRGIVSGRHAITYAVALGAVGFTILALYVNALVVLIGLIGLVDYVILYGYSKRHSVYGTIVGSISGATPVVAGYCAVTDRFDLGALILLLILVLWQMPHFYAIAMYRLDDYTAASLPVLPVKKGMYITKLNILLYIVAFTMAVAALTFYAYAGVTYLVVMLLLGFTWLWMGVRGFKAPDDKRWARKMFFFSLIVILVLSVMLAVGSVLP